MISKIKEFINRHLGTVTLHRVRPFAIVKGAAVPVLLGRTQEEGRLIGEMTYVRFYDQLHVEACPVGEAHGVLVSVESFTANGGWSVGFVKWISNKTFAEVMEQYPDEPEVSI